MVSVELLVRVQVQVHVTAHVLLLIHVSEVHTAICDIKKRNQPMQKLRFYIKLFFGPR